MIALLLGIISLVIAIMFATSFDKLANEVRDVRIKYLKSILPHYNLKLSVWDLIQ